MNNFKKYIETLNTMESQYAHIRHNDSEFEAIEQAKDVLNEQQERENGCEYCNNDALDNLALTNVFDHPKIVFRNIGDVDEDEHLCFCPKCGRRLKKVKKDEE